MTALSLRRRRGLWPTEPAGGGSWGQGDSEGAETQAGSEAARQGGEAQPDLSPTASEDEA